MAFKKRKYGDYPEFNLPDSISGAALKRLQQAIGTGVFTKVTKDVEVANDPEPEQPETPAEEPAGEEEVSQD